MPKTQDYILEIQKNMSQAPIEGFTVLLVEANPKKGFNYSYLLCYPNENMKNTLVMDCLNDYEDPIEENETVSKIDSQENVMKDKTKHKGDGRNDN